MFIATFSATRLRRALIAMAVISLVTGFIGFAGVNGATVTAAAPPVNSAFTWGSSFSGELGNGTTNTSLTPVAVTSSGALAGESIVEISGTSSTFCALTASGKVFCWGNGGSGQLGNGTTSNSPVPVAVDMSGALAGKIVTQVAVLTSAACALTSDGAVYCWGSNSFGELGDGTTNNRTVPTPVLASGVLAGRTATSLAPGGFATVCAVLDNGTLSCWGAGIFGQMGNGTTEVRYVEPTLVNMTGVFDGKMIAQAAVGWFQVCAVTTDNVLSCWGRNVEGQLGNGTFDDSSTPTLAVVTGLSGQVISSINGGTYSMCLTTTVGGAYCWGKNTRGQLGDGTLINRNVPTSVDMSGILAGERVATIAVSSESGCATTTTGRAACWGQNQFGQLGTGAGPAAQLSPVWVDTSGVLANVFVEQVATLDYTTAVWGRPQSVPPTPAPVAASAPLDVVAVAGDRSAVVSWSPPASSGSFPVSTYQVQAAPGGRVCLVASPATSCEVARLANDVAYTFQARALTGAGWSSWSQPSVAVTPAPVDVASILISGTRGEVRGGSGIVVTGGTSGFGMGAIVRPWVRAQGQSSFTQSAREVLVDVKGEFTWQRRGVKTMTVFVETPDGSVRSNRVTIPTR